ncbi:MAG: Alpha/beta hydrolase fold:Esterase/lipase/thioesterase, active site [Bradyrhizobium sp.]|nr:Alpha/beta hydrolase fold:Esterase/lipase/thioesterase, active site [Bradyrhizobium sp.]
MTERHRLWVDHAGERIALARWGDPDSSKPPALLVHGTGFVAEVWDEVARELVSKYTVYGIDRRGHGASHKPPVEQYHFLDFATDICAVVEALDLTDIYGVGHSAGATDLLLAAKLLPRRFQRLFVMEPTIMDPRAMRTMTPEMRERETASAQGVLRRQAEFDSPAAVFTRYRAAPAFADWSEASLSAYVQHGFEPQPDGRVRLLCRPDIEAAMLGPIFEAMAQVYTGDERGNPFGWLSGIECPVRVATAEKSWPIYKEMAARAVALIPDVSQWTFDGVGHCVAQEAPGKVLEALAAFERKATEEP